MSFDGGRRRAFFLRSRVRQGNQLPCRNPSRLPDPIQVLRPLLLSTRSSSDSNGTTCISPLHSPSGRPPSAEKDIPEIEARRWRRDVSGGLHIQIPEVFDVVILYSLRARRFVAPFWPTCTTRSSASARLAAQESEWRRSYRTSTFPVTSHMRVTAI